MRPRSHFRPDIEGLRAVAVLAVVAGHTSPSILRAGFAGVDVFFVISGYLIGRHLLEDIQGGEFSFLRFYGRRARRILPALVIVLLAVWACGWLILSPAEFSPLGMHTAAAAVFSNNLLLASESGYFDAAATTKPLLHLWSLGVEEQFYLLVPLLLWLSSRGRRASIAWVLWLGIASLLLTVLSLDPSHYLIQTRFWELAAGVVLGYIALGNEGVNSADSTGGIGYRGVLAAATAVTLAVVVRFTALNEPLSGASAGLAVLLIAAGSAAWMTRASSRPSVPHRLLAFCSRHESWLRNMSGMSGAAVIVMSFVALAPVGWPGPQTVLPVLGSLLLIGAGPAAASSRVLSWRPLVFIGGISYPLYLWHWPAIVFARMLFPAAGVPALLAAASLALALAWGTRELIENPVRAGRVFAVSVPAPPVWALLSALLVSGLVGWSAVATDGYPSRVPASLAAIAGWTVPDQYGPWRDSHCYFQPGHALRFAAECTPARRPGVPRLLLWGDSHAAELYQGFVPLREQYDFDLVQWTAAGCAPTLTAFMPEQARCPDLRTKVQRELTVLAPDAVLLVGAWERYIELGAPQETILAATEANIRWLQQSGVPRIVLFGPGPTWNATLPKDLYRYMLLHRTQLIPERLGGVSGDISRLDEAMASQARSLGVQYVSIAKYFCDSRGCRTLGDAAQQQRPDLLFCDRDHLTQSGAVLLMEAAAPRIFGAVAVAGRAAD
jgi:peptidoglycan/LPS O-acetylase OafA/YrhL